jgi:hypothetical protein
MLLPLVHSGQEQLTVSSSPLGITAALITGNIVQARIQHAAGGDIYWTTSSTTANDAGSNGEHRMTTGLLQGNELVLKGLKAITDWRAIKLNSASDATLQIELLKGEE